MNARRLAWVAFCLPWAWSAAGAHAQTLVLGMLDPRPPAVLQARMGPLVQHLSTQLAMTLELRALDGAALDLAVTRNEIDLVLTHPSHFLELRSRSALTGALATLVRRQGPSSTASLGGVIIVRADSSIQALADLRGRRVATPRELGVGAFQAQALELHEAGVRPPAQDSLLRAGSPLAVAEAVRDAKADAGFLRTGQLEELMAGGHLRQGEFRMINEQRLSGYPFRLSTRLYPEWPVVALPHVDARVVRRVAAALLALDPDHPAAIAAGIAGFDPPADYLPVERLARTLRVPPFDQAPPVRLQDLWVQHQPAFVVGGLATVAVVGLLLLAGRNRQLQAGNRQLQQSRRLLQTVIDTAPVSVFWKDLELRFLGANQAFAADHGLGQGADVVGKDDFALVDPERARRHREDDRQVLDNAQAKLGYEIQVKGADGREHWLRSSKVPLRDDAGAVFGVLGIYEDVSDLRARQQEVLETRNQLQATLDALPDLMFEIDLEGRYHDAHSPRSDLLAVPIEHVIGRTVQELLPVDVAAVCERALAEALRQGHTYGHQYALDLPAGRRWFELSAARKAGPEGSVPRFILIARDITERRNTEAELERHRNHLEALVAERTTELVAARDTAQDASRAKSAFLANMSHEIRTPLNAVLGMAHLLRRSELSEQQRGWLQSLSGAGEHLLEVLNAVLDLSKIEAGKFALDLAPVDLGLVISNVHSMVAERAAAKGLALQVEVADRPPPLLGDATRLQQALLNYAHNAVKFTATGRVTLRLQVTAEDAESVEARLEVEDTGIGIDAQTLPRLFTTFEQADNSPTRSFGGTGLGLAITRRLAALMGGDAGASSQPGVGSTFWFTVRLPRAPATAPSPDAPAEAGWGEAERRLRLELPGRRVLLAEDDPINREVAIALLELAGQQVEVAVDGEQAVAKVATQRYDLVLMDMQMPRLDGLQAARRIRALPGAATLPIVALTANAFAEDRERCLAAGMNDFVAKPLDMGELYAALLRWMK